MSNPTPPAKIPSLELRGFFFMESGSPCSIPRARAGKLSVIRLIQRVTGPSLRATGVARDLRTTMFEYDDFDFNVVTQPDGDVKSNLIMRALESFESIKLIRQAIANIPEGKVINRDWEMFDTDLIESYIEVPRGTLYHSYALESGRVRHCIIRTPSMANIGAMQYACIGDQITDAQLCIVQWDPCFTCTDRAIEIVRR